MKKLIIYSLMLIIFSSCADYLDINTDPNNSTAVPPGTLMTNAMIALSQVRLTTLNPDAAAFIQHWKPVVVLTGPDTYVFSAIGNNNFWTFTFYGDIIKDLNLAILQEEGLGNNNAIAQLKICQAFSWIIGVDRWGEMPFTESNVAGITAPAFDTGDIIYQGIIDLLDEAISLVDLNNQSEPNTIVNFDPVYDGNMNLWLSFANSLKLRVLMRISNVENRDAEIAALINSGGPFIDAVNGSKNAEFRYLSSRVNQNFDYATFDNFTSLGSFQLDGSTRLHQRWRLASRTLVDLLKSLDDPRLNSFYQPDASNTTGEFVGVPNGSAPLPPTAQRGYVSLFYIRQDKSDEWFLASEYYLLLAEAYARGIVPGGTAAAQTALENGVRASLNHFDGSDFAISTADKDDYIGSLSLSDQANPVSFIQTQQYIALFYNSNEAWSNWRRTKVPALPVPVGAPIQTIIRRIEIPSQEIENNRNAPRVSPLIDRPVYFEP